MSEYRKVLDESVIATSNKRGFRAVQHGVASYEQTMKGLIYFYLKRSVEDDGTHTKHLLF